MTGPASKSRFNWTICPATRSSGGVTLVSTACTVPMAAAPISTTLASGSVSYSICTRWPSRAVVATGPLAGLFSTCTRAPLSFQARPSMITLPNPVTVPTA